MAETKYEFYDDPESDLAYSGNHWGAQTFTATSDHPMNRVVTYIVTGNVITVTVGIRDTDGLGHPTGGDLLTKIIAGPFGTAGVKYTIDFPTSLELANGVKYAIVVRASAASVAVKRRFTAPAYPDGNMEDSVNGGVAWSELAQDWSFEIWFVTGPPKVTSTRTTASYAAIYALANLSDKGGFTVTRRGFAYNTTGGDPDPTVDSKVEETGDFPVGAFDAVIPNDLANATYYVRPYAYSEEEGYGYGVTLTVKTISAIVIATLNSRFVGVGPPSTTYADARAGERVVISDPTDTAPDNLCGVDDTYTASPYLRRTFFYFDLRQINSRFSGVNLVVWSYDLGAAFEEVHVIEGVQGFELPTVADWIAENAVGPSLGSLLDAGITTGGYVKIPLNNDGVTFVKSKVDDYCKLCLMTRDDFENNYNPVVHNGYWHFYLPHESGKEPYLEFIWDPYSGNQANILAKGNFI